MDYLRVTDQNVLNTYLADSIGRNVYVTNFCQLLNTFDESTVIALDGQWGSGKSFFMKQVKLCLDAFNNFVEMDEEIRKDVQTKAASYIGSQNPLNDNPMLTVYYDAWLNDNALDPVLSIVNSIIRELDLKETIAADKKLLDIVSTISTSVSFSHISFNLGNAVNQMKAHDYLAGEKNLQDIRKKVQKFFDILKNERGNRVNIIIDELDRCSPQYAVLLLERIKHYLEHDNITFIFAINTRSLEKSIRHFYGNDIEGTRYLDRFFDMRMMLPPIHMEKIIDHFDFGQSYVGKELCKSLAMKMDMSLRETLRYAKQYKTASGILTSQATDFYAELFQKWRMYYLPLAIAFQLTDMERFHSFISGDGKSDLHYIWECDTINRSLLRSFSNAAVQGDSDEVDQEVIHGIEEYYETCFSSSGNIPIEVYDDYIYQEVRQFAFQTVGCFTGC